MARPLKYETVQDLQAAIDEYFLACEGEMLKDDDGKPVLNKWGEPVMLGRKPPTVTGLALSLGFAGRQALLNYQGRAAFKDTILRAKSRCEEYAETRLFDKDGSNGAKFSLSCNFGWSDNSNTQSQNKKDPSKLFEALERDSNDD